MSHAEILDVLEIEDKIENKPFLQRKKLPAGKYYIKIHVTGKVYEEEKATLEAEQHYVKINLEDIGRRLSLNVAKILENVVEKEKIKKGRYEGEYMVELKDTDLIPYIKKIKEEIMKENLKEKLAKTIYNWNQNFEMYIYANKLAEELVDKYGLEAEKHLAELYNELKERDKEYKQKKMEEELERCKRKKEELENRNREMESIISELRYKLDMVRGFLEEKDMLAGFRGWIREREGEEVHEDVKEWADEFFS